MLWDKLWEKHQNKIAKLSVEEWIEMAIRCIKYSVDFLDERRQYLNVESTILTSIRRFRESIESKQRLSKQDEEHRQSLVERFENDDDNMDFPGILDMLMAFDLFRVDLVEVCVDDLADCMSYCYQCIYGVEILGAMSDGEVLFEKESESRERKNSRCVECIDFQSRVILEFCT